MSEVCATCGLPKDLCVCETLAVEGQKITVSVVKRRFGKLATVVEGLDEKRVDLKTLLKNLKLSLLVAEHIKTG